MANPLFDPITPAEDAWWERQERQDRAAEQAYYAALEDFNAAAASGDITKTLADAGRPGQTRSLAEIIESFAVPDDLAALVITAANGGDAKAAAQKLLKQVAEDWAERQEEFATPECW